MADATAQAAFDAYVFRELAPAPARCSACGALTDTLYEVKVRAPLDASVPRPILVTRHVCEACK